MSPADWKRAQGHTQPTPRGAFKLGVLWRRWVRQRTDSSDGMCCVSHRCCHASMRKPEGELEKKARQHGVQYKRVLEYLSRYGIR